MEIIIKYGNSKKSRLEVYANLTVKKETFKIKHKKFVNIHFCPNSIKGNNSYLSSLLYLPGEKTKDHVLNGDKKKTRH